MVVNAASPALRTSGGGSSSSMDASHIHNMASALAATLTNLCESNRPIAP